MASITKTFKEDWYSKYKATWTLVLSGTDLSVTAVGQNLKYAHPTLTAIWNRLYPTELSGRAHDSALNPNRTNPTCHQATRD